MPIDAKSPTSTDAPVHRFHGAREHFEIMSVGCGVLIDEHRMSGLQPSIPSPPVRLDAPFRPARPDRRRRVARARLALASVAAVLGALSPLGHEVVGAQGEQVPGSSTEATAGEPQTVNPRAGGSFEPQATAAAPMLGIEGKGFGHGRGMGQWGALGYATAWEIPYPVILDHYYGGTSKAVINTNYDVRVRLSRFDDTHFVLASDLGNLMTSATGDQRYQTLLVIPEADGTWSLWAGADCAGTWGWAYLLASANPVQFWIAGGNPAAADHTQWVATCERDGSLRYYRGFTETVVTPVRTGLVNHVPVEQYVRGVVPREMPAWWGDRNGPWGIQALAVQAVAARSYVLTEGRAPGYWHTCDTAACQVYGGAATWSPSAGGSMLEDWRTDEAVRNTAGEVRLRPDGTIARTEYSASTGGWTAGLSFPAVQDQGDPLPDNPNYLWHYDVSAEALQEHFPAIGRVERINVTGRNGLGQWGGRATEVHIEGSDGSVVTDGDTVNWLLGLGTDWFEVSTIR
jgi:SpoIID/LytB domain protein